jgi:putative ABC transport system permease protein
VTSTLVAQVLAGLGFAAVAAALAQRAGLGLGPSIGRAAARAVVQLAAVGAFLAAVFAVPALAVIFVGVMLSAAALTAGGRLAPLPRGRIVALGVIALPAFSAAAVLVAVGAFAATPRATIPTVGILLGGAMTATSICGRHLMAGLDISHAEIETRLCLGDDARTALEPVTRRAVIDGVIPVLDQTRSVGLVTLPGTFVGLVLGGASPARAASTQLVVLLALIAVELGAALLLARVVVRAVTAPGERVRTHHELRAQSAGTRAWPALGRSRAS